MANHDGPSPVRAVEGNLSGLSRRLKAAANVLDAAVFDRRLQSATTKVKALKGGSFLPIIRSKRNNVQREMITVAVTPPDEGSLRGGPPPTADR